MKEAEKGLIAKTAGVKRERKCRKCGTLIGKSKQLCEGCKSTPKYARPELGKMQCPAAVLNFRRDESGDIIQKLCTKCHEWKDADQFPKRKDTASGLASFCRPCFRGYRKKFHKPVIPQFKQMQCKQCGKEFGSFRIRSFCGDMCKNESFNTAQRMKLQSIHVVTHTKCRRCGETKEISEFRLKGQTNDFKCKPTACRSCKEENKKGHKIAGRLKRNKDPKHKIRRSLSRRMRELVNQAAKGGTKNLKEVLGCSSAFLRYHIESQFKRGMSWNNYGTHWHVDHIVPCAAFDHSDADQVKRCWHYSNLRPLEAEENIAKSDSIIECQPELLLQLT